MDHSGYEVLNALEGSIVQVKTARTKGRRSKKEQALAEQAEQLASEEPQEEQPEQEQPPQTFPPPGKAEKQEWDEKWKTILTANLNNPACWEVR
jgi:hypothetical protein